MNGAVLLPVYLRGAIEVFINYRERGVRNSILGTPERMLFARDIRYYRIYAIGQGPDTFPSMLI